MNDFRRLLPFVKPYFPVLGLSLVLLVFAGISEVLTTALAIPMFDQVLTPAPTASADKMRFLQHYISMLPGGIVTQLAISLLMLTAVKGLCLYYSNYGMSRVGQSVVMDLRNALYHHMLGQSMGFFSMNSTGRLMSRMNSDVEQVQEAVSTSVAELFREVVLLVSLVVWVVYIDWQLAGMALIIAPAALVVTLSMGKRIRRASLMSRENVASLNDLLQQSITGMRVLKAFGMEAHEENRFRKSSWKLFLSNLRAARILFLNSPAMEMLGVVCFIPLLYYAHGRMESGTLTMGIFGGSLFALFRMYDPIRKLSRIHVQFQKAFASASRIGELLETHIEIHDRPGARLLEGVEESVEFRKVFFDYDGNAAESSVLRDIELKIGRNQVVALVGASGSGKSTLVSLIPRFYDVISGSVRIDDADIRDYTQESLRRNIAIVTQETFLFNDTIRSNIAYGDIRMADEKVVEAAKAAFAHDFIMNFPDGYDTLIGERGQRLSGGERQRVAIARAILKNSPILILDEATSALDSESEKIVQQALANLMRERTTFVIAHRLSTVRNADLIVVLDRGRILERGTHDELIERDGMYARLHRLQTEFASPRSAGAATAP